MINFQRSFGIIFFGKDSDYRATLAQYLGETLKFKVIRPDGIIPLADILRQGPTGYIFDGLPVNKKHLQIIHQWSEQNGYQLDVVLLGVNKQEKELMSIVNQFQDQGARIHEIGSQKNLQETVKELFIKLSPYIFLEDGMAEGYYLLRESCSPEYGEHIFISGMPTFVYGGRVLMKDFDILVPGKKIEIIAQTIGTPIKIKDSSVAHTRSSYVGSSVEAISDLVVYVNGQKIPFDFDFLWEEVKLVRFMGMKVPIMGLEDLILFKVALGRVGIDDFGKHKDDLIDVEGLFGVQKVNLDKLYSRARQLGLEERLTDKLNALNIIPPSFS